MTDFLMNFLASDVVASAICIALFLAPMYLLSGKSKNR